MELSPQEVWEKFRIQQAKEPSLTIKIDTCMARQYGLDIFPKQQHPVVLKCENALLAANEDWSEAQITLLDDKREGITGALSALLMTHLSTRDGLLMHASVVETKRGGLLFLGPSGIGKTTQAELWQRYRGACIINGDMTFIHHQDGKFWGVGSPWHGSSPYCENKRVPLSAIIVLEQAPENSIKRLEGMPMVDRVMRNLFLPSWYEVGVNAACETLDQLLGKVPVYLLACRPEEAAVALTERVVWQVRV